jgi:hypothetical protein
MHSVRMTNQIKALSFPLMNLKQSINLLDKLKISKKKLICREQIRENKKKMNQVGGTPPHLLMKKTTTI